MQKDACWVFETVQINLIVVSLVCFTEKVYGSSPYSPIKKKNNPITYKRNKVKKRFTITNRILISFFFIL